MDVIGSSSSQIYNRRDSVISPNLSYSTPICPGFVRYVIPITRDSSNIPDLPSICRPVAAGFDGDIYFCQNA